MSLHHLRKVQRVLLAEPVHSKSALQATLCISTTYDLRELVKNSLACIAYLLGPDVRLVLFF